MLKKYCVFSNCLQRPISLHKLTRDLSVQSLLYCIFWMTNNKSRVLVREIYLDNSWKKYNFSLKPWTCQTIKSKCLYFQLSGWQLISSIHFLNVGISLYILLSFCPSVLFFFHHFFSISYPTVHWSSRQFWMLCPTILLSFIF